SSAASDLQQSHPIFVHHTPIPNPPTHKRGAQIQATNRLRMKGAHKIRPQNLAASEFQKESEFAKQILTGSRNRSEWSGAKRNGTESACGNFEILLNKSNSCQHILTAPRQHNLKA
ncbi:MAG: hypothetical protein K2G32_11370, partial [Oscillospiraceae bacterium]|nr:hypothetical protein [Oscillospiraceae bacterium]